MRFGSTSDTMYEIVFEKNGKTVRLGFANRYNKHGLLPIAQKTRAKWENEVFDADDNIEVCGAGKKAKFKFSNGAVIRFTGRTEKNCNQ